MRIFSGIQPTGTKHLGNYLGVVYPVLRAADVLAYRAREVPVGRTSVSTWR